MPTKISSPKPRLALIKDWLTSYGGSEEQLLQLHQLYPEAPIYTSVYDQARLPQFKGADVRTMSVPAWLAKGRRFEKLAWMLPGYFRSLDLSKFDLVISVTSGFAKGVRVSGKTKHLCICNTPLRFAWGLGGDRRGLTSQLFSGWFRRSDLVGSRGVDVFYANSKNVARRIKEIYGRKSKVLYPPVQTENFASVKRSPKPSGFVTIGRLVAYKRVDIIVRACEELNRPLTVIGDGPELKRLETLSNGQTKFFGFASQETVKKYLAKSEAFLFAAEEDFGIAPVEALAAGCPVIAYAAGGVLETVENGVTGILFKPQTVTALKKSLKNFSSGFKEMVLRRQAERFSVKNFRQGVTKAIATALSPDFKRY